MVSVLKIEGALMAQRQSLMTDLAIQQINALGGPQLPTGVSTATLKVIMENIAASQAVTSRYKISAVLNSWQY
jgi:response regulator of citrate/malate metabolism